MITAEEIYSELYPNQFGPIQGYTLDEIRLRPIYSEVMPHQVDISTYIGPIKLNLPLLSAAMDTVTGPELASALSEVGGCGVIYRHKKAETQLKWVEQALKHKPCLVANPKSLSPNQVLDDAKEILDAYGFSTIPVISESKTLLGILFTQDIAFEGHVDEPVKKWMKPFCELKTESTNTSFDHIKRRLLNEHSCSVLPIVNHNQKFEGIYFMKDFFNANPSYHNGKPLVGMAIGVNEKDLERVEEALKFGIGIIVIDSSHGNSPAVINQAKEVVRLAAGRAVVIAGNVADVDGYLRLAGVGVDGVKAGIGCGATCTTSSVTGAGFPIFTLIRELNYTRKKLLENGDPAPSIIPDGGLDDTGNCVVALAAGGSACMSGKQFVAAQESLSYQNEGSPNGYVRYRGMASKAAIKSRIADRYGKQKRAPEGEEGMVVFRGPLKNWIGDDVEWIQGGFSHVGAKSITELQKIGNLNHVFVRFSGFGRDQIKVRLNERWPTNAGCPQPIHGG